MDRRTLTYRKPYMHGDDVKAVQLRLQGLGYFGGSIGGNYGPITYEAVRAYQKDHGIKEFGKVLPFTWDSLFPAVDPNTWSGKLTSFAAEQVKNGSIYVLGAQGQTGTQINEKWIMYREHDISSNYKRAIAFWKKQLEKGYADLHAYDCSGLVVKFLLDNNLLDRDLNANGLYYTACDAIEKNKLVAGDLVFKKKATSSRIYHVGIYMGDGTVVHSKGRDYGVVRESIFATGWNRFGRLKGWSD
jgi:peptidoglycan hydrolase-like protein with peptidoglycan-binding domain